VKTARDAMLRKIRSMGANPEAQLAKLFAEIDIDGYGTIRYFLLLLCFVYGLTGAMVLCHRLSSAKYHIFFDILTGTHLFLRNRSINQLVLAPMSLTCL
jgi:hypothetical protein